MDVTDDAFLGGALQILQPKIGYRAGVDPVLLAASVMAKAGDRLLDLGCGGGIAALCAARRIPGLQIAGVELQPDYAALAVRNAARNQIDMDVYTGDIQALPFDVRQRQFDHVIANPPYFDRYRSVPASNQSREAGLGEAAPLDAWAKAAAKRLAPKGMATFIQRGDRLADLISALSTHLHVTEVQPLAPRVGRTAHLVLVRAAKSSKADFRLHAPLVVHTGDEHQEKVNDYNVVIDDVLRSGGALPFGGYA